MWFILQGLIIFGVFCWIGQYVDYVAELDMKRAAGMLGGIVALAVTYLIVYANGVLAQSIPTITRHNLGPNFGPKLPGPTKGGAGWQFRYLLRSSVIDT